MRPVADDDPISAAIARNLGRVRDRIARACERARRDPSEVRLVAVTKSVGDAEVLALARLGVTDAGENRTDALVSRRAHAEAAGVHVRWHMIGRLQTNKVRRALPAIDLLHSLDRDSLAETLARELAGRAEPLAALVQVNVAGEPTKAGYAPGALFDALERLRAVPGLAVTGLMTMAPLAADAEASRPVFRLLRELRDEAKSRRYLSALELSMGMSQDYEVAVEEGATLVRVGTALFADTRSA